MKIDELKKELGNRNFYKLCFFGILILITIIGYYIKGSNIDINWELIGFIGVIITIIYTEKSRKKQNKYEYLKEKITDEQREFKHVIKEKIDLLNFSFFIDDFISISFENFQEVNLKIDRYIKQLIKINIDILWFYSQEMVLPDSEIDKLLKNINLIRSKYIIELRKYSELLSKFTIIKMMQTYDQMEIKGGISEAKKCEIDEFRKNNKSSEELLEEIRENRFPIINEIIEYSEKNIYELYDSAQKVVEERDLLMKEKLEKQN